MNRHHEDLSPYHTVGTVPNSNRKSQKGIKSISLMVGFKFLNYAVFSWYTQNVFNNTKCYMYNESTSSSQDSPVKYI